MSRSFLRPTAVAVAALFSAAAAAQIPLSGNVSGTLAPAVYHASGSLTVPVGQTLTLPAGVIVKFSGGQLQVDGTLITSGTAGNPVIFTALADDSAGGDTNGNGPSSGGPTAWQGIVFAATAGNSVLQFADIRYGGSGFVSNLELNSCNAQFLNCVVRDCYTHGMDLNGTSFPTVTNCTFVGNGNFAVEGIPLAALAGFANNAAANNSANHARVTTANLTGSLSLTTAAHISGAIVVDCPIDVGAGASLTLGAGVVVKWRSAQQMTVHGTLRTFGTANSPVVLTGLADDSAGGDTNGNGPSTAGATAWRGIVFAPTSSASDLRFADIRYGGSGFVSNLELDGCSPSFTDCVVRGCYTHGLDLNATATPHVTRCQFVDNGGFAIEGVAMAALPRLLDNTATGNQGNAGNYARITQGDVLGQVQVGPRSMLGGALVLDAPLNVPNGATLTLSAGVHVKFRSAQQVTIDGTLLTNGTSSAPVVFTGLGDDTAGGDTNGNGPSTAAPTAFRGLVFQAGSDASTLDWTEIRYGGSGFVSNLELADCSPTFRNCTIRNCYTHGMDLNQSATPTVSDCTFADNGGNAVESVPIRALPGFVNNQGTPGAFLRITSAVVDGLLEVGPEAMLNGAFVMATNLDVAATGRLVVHQGCHFKFQTAHEVAVAGRIELRGTGYEPVVFTGLADDEFGGDTNGNGPSSASAAAWRGVTVLQGAGQSRLENVRIRFTGSSFAPGLQVSSPQVALQAVRVDRAFDRGIVLADVAGAARNLVAWNCGNHGIHLTGGNFDVVHATVTGCARGVRVDGWNGTVVNSNIWGNSTNFANLTNSAQVVRSNGGFTGSNGNLNVDPLFVDAANGNLRLQATSPCLGAADLGFGVTTVRDFDHNSRVLDAALTGVALPDMGAFEYSPWDMVLQGEVRPGSTPTLTITGQPGFSLWFLGLLDGAQFAPPYGMLLAGLPGPNIALLWPQVLPVGFPFPFPLVNDPGLIGIEAGIQTVTFPVHTVGAGNFTRMFRARIRP